MSLTRRDWMVGIIAGLHVATHAITNMAMWMLASCASVGGAVEATVQTFERNPTIALAVKQTNFLAVFVSYAYIPASIIAGYILFRRFVKGKNEIYLDFFVIMLLFSMIANFSNDLGALLGMML